MKTNRIDIYLPIENLDSLITDLQELQKLLAKRENYEETQSF